MTEYFDPDTPRLELGEVRTFVTRLPQEALDTLLQGPQCSGCGVCDALEPMLADGANFSKPVIRAARKLQEWHDDLAWSDGLADVIEKRVIHPESYDRVCDELHDALGVLQYARCGVIYALALAETSRRVL